MGSILSSSPLRFRIYRLVAGTLAVPSHEIVSLKKQFCALPGSTISKLINLHNEVFSEVNWGRFLIFLNFVEQLGLTEEEWTQLYDFLLPTLNRVTE